MGPGPAEAATVFASLSTLMEIVKGGIGLRDLAKLQGVLTDLQSRILSAQETALTAQQEHSRVLDEVRSLKRRLEELESWESEKLRYELVDHGGGTFTRRLRPEMANDDPPHRLCAQCFEVGRKGILQSQGHNYEARETVECLSCGKSVRLGSPSQDGFEPTVLKSDWNWT